MYNNLTGQSQSLLFILGAFGCLLLMLLLRLLLMFLLIMCTQLLCIMLVGLLKNNFESLKVFLWCKLSSEFFDQWSLIWDIIGCPSPSVVTCFQNLENSNNVFLSLHIMIHNTFECFFCSCQYSNEPTFFVLEETEFSNPSLLPFWAETIDFGSKLGEFLLLFLSSDNWHFWEVNNCPVSNNFFLHIFVLVVSFFFLLVVFWLVLFWFFLFEHKLK